jgi:hypothetical protein
MALLSGLACMHNSWCNYPLKKLSLPRKILKTNGRDFSCLPDLWF